MGRSMSVFVMKRETEEAEEFAAIQSRIGNYLSCHIFARSLNE